MYSIYWNSLDIDIKATADLDEFQKFLKEKYLSNYITEIQLLGTALAVTKTSWADRATLGTYSKIYSEVTCHGLYFIRFQISYNADLNWLMHNSKVKSK